MATIRGVDASVWQGNNVDYNALKDQGIKFVILRAGYGSALDHPSQFDGAFEINYKKATDAGLDVGAYWYSYADSPEAAVKEAKACISKLKGKKFSYPIYFDLEELSQLRRGKAFCDSLVNAFCGELEKAGYFAGLYCSTYWLTTSVSESVRKRYTVWVAEYNPKCNYTGDYGIWQNGTIPCQSAAGKVIDHNYCYADYPATIKAAGLNGYEKSNVKPAEPAKPVEPTKKSVEEIAKEVIAGKWDTGDKRKKLLTDAGYDYNAVQAKVNEMLGVKKSITAIAQEVIAGKWGNGNTRKTKLTAAGYDYNAVQAEVNKMLKNK